MATVNDALDFFIGFPAMLVIGFSIGYLCGKEGR